MSEAHLQNAAKTLERILARRNPEHVFSVEVGPRKSDDAAGTTVAPAGQGQVGTEPPDANAVSDGDSLTGSDSPDSHRSEEAA